MDLIQARFQGGSVQVSAKALRKMSILSLLAMGGGVGLNDMEGAGEIRVEVGC